MTGLGTITIGTIALNAVYGILPTETAVDSTSPATLLCLLLKPIQVVSVCYIHSICHFSVIAHYYNYIIVPMSIRFSALVHGFICIRCL